ncbi:hypothetical protein Tco_0712381 [Tanacetum coccineum]
MVTVPIYQASLSIPPLSTPIINISPPKLVPPPVQEPIFTTTTTTTTTLPPPPPPPLQSTIYPNLAIHVSALEKQTLEVSMQCDNNDELHEALATSRKRPHDDPDPSSPPP